MGHEDHGVGQAANIASLETETGVADDLTQRGDINEDGLAEPVMRPSDAGFGFSLLNAARRPGLRYRLKRNRRPVDQQDHLAAENAADNFLQSVSLADRANRDKPLFEDGDQRARRGLCWKAEMLS